MADTAEAVAALIRELIRSAQPRAPQQPDPRYRSPDALGPAYLGNPPPQSRTREDMTMAYSECLNGLKIEQCDALDSVIRELAHLLTEPQKKSPAGDGGASASGRDDT
jgi:hypothetical protein